MVAEKGAMLLILMFASCLVQPALGEEVSETMATLSAQVRSLKETESAQAHEIERLRRLLSGYETQGRMLQEGEGAEGEGEGEKQGEGEGGEGEGEGEGGEGEGEGEEEPTAAGVAIAATLMVSISFVMCLYYFISYPDEDIQEIAWFTISRTISIFCAVLLFSSLNDLAETYIIAPVFGEDPSSLGALLVDFCHMMFWFIVMQIVCAFMSGAAGPWKVDGDEFKEFSDEKQEDLMRAKKCNMACYAMLLAHITGFASINCFMTLQQQPFFRATWGTALLVVPIVFVFMSLIQLGTDCVREHIAHMDDDGKDEFEELWDEECEVSENDVMGLTLSFVTVSALRFMITGCLPNQEGKEEVCAVEEYIYFHTTDQKVALMGLGVAFTILIFVLRLIWPDCLEPKAIKQRPSEEQEVWKVLKRLFEGVYFAVCMAFSWTFFYGTQMIFAGMSAFEGRVEILSVTIALVLSLVCMTGLIPLDMLADSDCTGPKCDAAIRSVMSAMGLLIGFSWEQTFDESVWAISMKTEGSDIPFINSHSTKFLLSVFCAVLLVPAWKMYMLPYIVAEGWLYQLSFKIEDIEGIVKQYCKVEEKNRAAAEDIFAEMDSDDEEAREEKRLQKLKRLERVRQIVTAVNLHADKLTKELTGVQPVKKNGAASTLSDDALPPLLPLMATPTRSDSVQSGIEIQPLLSRNGGVQRVISQTMPQSSTRATYQGPIVSPSTSYTGLSTWGLNRASMPSPSYTSYTAMQLPSNGFA